MPARPDPSPSVPLVGDLARRARIRGSMRDGGSAGRMIGLRDRCVASSVTTSGEGAVGGDEETRTPDPLLAKEMLCQLSYVPRAGG